MKSQSWKHPCAGSYSYQMKDMVLLEHSPLWHHIIKQKQGLNEEWRTPFHKEFFSPGWTHCCIGLNSKFIHFSTCSRTICLRYGECLLKEHISCPLGGFLKRRESCKYGTVLETKGNLHFLSFWRAFYSKYFLLLQWIWNVVNSILVFNSRCLLLGWGTTWLIRVSNEFGVE